MHHLKQNGMCVLVISGKHSEFTMMTSFLLFLKTSCNVIPNL
jgi:hypothetical protein